MIRELAIEFADHGASFVFAGERRHCPHAVFSGGPETLRVKLRRAHPTGAFPL
jgi:hypothetical protein